MNQPQQASAGKLWILLCVSVPSFMINLDANIVAVSLPAMGRSLNANFSAIEWVISAYTLTFAALMLPAGGLADRYGRKRMLLCGLAIFTLASFICGAAPSIGILNAARALQGVGAALQLSAALAILSNEFRGAQRAKAFAFWGSVIGIAITLGPVAGGLITQTLGWEWAFYINIPVGLAIMGLTLFAVRESKDPGATRLDIPGSSTFAGALFLVTLALISANHTGWQDFSVHCELAAALLLFIVFLIVESRQPRPMLDLRIFTKRTYVGANVAGLAFAASLLTMLTYLPMYFQNGLQVAPLTAGLLMLPMALPLFLVPRITTKYLTHRFSGRALLATGLGTVAVGMAWLAVFSTELRYASMLTGMLIAGIGAGILNGETAKVAMSVIPPERAGMASGVAGTIRFTGIVVGFAALGAILYGRVTSFLAGALPIVPEDERHAMAQRVAAGDLSVAGGASDGLRLALHASFGAGYQAIFLTAACFALLAAFGSWMLIRTTDTAPLTARHGLPEALPME